MTVEIVCEDRDWDDLNYSLDNHGTPIDCRDKKTGELYQVKGRKLYIHPGGWKGWTFSYFQNDWYKKYKSVVCVCYNEDFTKVDEIYEFPSDKIKGKTNFSITKNPDPSKGPYWYQEYRTKGVTKLNDILYKKLNKKNY